MPRPVTLVLIVLSCLALPAAAAAGKSPRTAGNTCRLVLEHHQFVPKELHARAGVPIIIELENRDDTPEEFESRRLRKEFGLRGHQSGRFTIHPLQAGHYEFTGEFHADTARGILIVE